VGLVISAFRANYSLTHVKDIAEGTIPSWTKARELSSRHESSASDIDEAYADGGLDPEDEKLLLHLKRYYRERLSDEW
jgi:hypothetical protein